MSSCHNAAPVETWRHTYHQVHKWSHDILVRWPSEFVVHVLKTESHHDADFVITCGIAGCRYYNLASDDKVGIMTRLRVIMMMSTLSSLVALQVVIMTTCNTTSDDKLASGQLSVFESVFYDYWSHIMQSCTGVCTCVFMHYRFCIA